MINILMRFHVEQPSMPSMTARDAKNNVRVRKIAMGPTPGGGEEEPNATSCP